MKRYPEKKFVVSFCNNRANIDPVNGEGILGLIQSNDEGSYDYQPIELNINKIENINGATGITAYQENFYVILQATKPVLVKLDKSFSVVGTYELDGLRGVHSICVHEEKLYLVSTRQDRVVIFDFLNCFRNFYDLDTGKDTHHLNSICVHDNQIYISGFGSNFSKHWTKAERGYVLNVTKKEKVITGLKQPHSLISHGDQIYLCDSSRQRVISITGETLYQETSGYVRGLGFSGKLAFYGISKGRQFSLTTGDYIGHISNSDILLGECQFVVHEEGCPKKTLNLSAVGNEIYDIISI